MAMANTTTKEFVGRPRMMDVLVMVVIVVVLATALGYSSQFLTLLNNSDTLTPTQSVFKSMNVAVVVITTLLLAMIIAGFIWSAVVGSRQTRVVP
jgi:hypothetical protein